MQEKIGRGAKLFTHKRIKSCLSVEEKKICISRLFDDDSRETYTSTIVGDEANETSGNVIRAFVKIRDVHVDFPAFSYSNRALDKVHRSPP